MNYLWAFPLAAVKTSGRYYHQLRLEVEGKPNELGIYRLALGKQLAKQGIVVRAKDMSGAPIKVLWWANGYYGNLKSHCVLVPASLNLSQHLVVEANRDLLGDEPELDTVCAQFKLPYLFDSSFLEGDILIGRSAKIFIGSFGAWKTIRVNRSLYYLSAAQTLNASQTIDLNRQQGNFIPLVFLAALNKI